MLYEPLSEDALETRVLDLEPSDRYDAEICCRLRKVNLLQLYETEPSQIKSFEAVSYTWGSNSKTKSVTVNGQAVQVTSNLEAFLRRRREPFDEVALWIDDLCIQQCDKEERNAQVSVMNMIYAAAAKLIIWLGPASDDSSLGVQLLTMLGAGSPYGKMPLLDRKELTALQNLLNRPWWTRVWIIQEVVCGGSGMKQRCIKVQCGDDSVLWTNVVVAAARIVAYASDQRQMFPNVGNILELDSLRERAFQIFSETTSRKSILELLCRYRHFQASEVRDKLYAICNMFPVHLVKRLETRYEADVKDVYLDFAVETMLADKDLDILRHCGPIRTEHSLPSWVPDWSLPLEMHPLPIRRIRRHYQVPWWANPIRTESDRFMVGCDIVDNTSIHFLVGPVFRDPKARAAHQSLELKKLKISANGCGEIRDLREIPSDFPFHKAPERVRNEIQDLLKQDNVIFTVQDNRCQPLGSETYSTEAPDALRQGEIITERRMKLWLLKELEDIDGHVKYCASGSTEQDFQIDKAASVLRVKGIIWETIEHLHDNFVEDLEADWKNATRFMVDVGSCKSMTVRQTKCIDRYGGLHGLMEAFWATVLAGQAIGPDEGQEAPAVQHRDFAQWLPEIPSQWQSSTPPMTPVTTGLLELSQVTDALNQNADIFHPKASWLSCEEFDPVNWPENEREQHKLELKTLADMWHKQPYDLYHRPFSFLHVIPDPYWPVRKTQDELALKKTQAFGSPQIISPALGEAYTQVKNSSVELDKVRDIADSMKKAMTSKPNMVPRDTLNPDVVKYALGRRFFITRHGYIGLGPKTAQVGDTVAVFCGLNVPFILRQRQEMSSQQCWQLVGETYVHGAMNGEVVEQCDLGLVESTEIHLT